METVSSPIKVNEVHPRSSRGGVEVQLYSFFNLGARWGRVVNTTPWPLYLRGRDSVPIVQVAGWGPGPVGTGAENVAPTGIFFSRILCFIVPVLDFQWSFVSYRTACCGFFQSDGFGRERTRDLGYQRPACKPLDHRRRCFDPRTVQPVASRYTNWAIPGH
jgi:hypothetical protein